MKTTNSNPKLWCAPKGPSPVAKTPGPIRPWLLPGHDDDFYEDNSD